MIIINFDGSSLDMIFQSFVNFVTMAELLSCNSNQQMNVLQQLSKSDI